MGDDQIGGLDGALSPQMMEYLKQKQQQPQPTVQVDTGVMNSMAQPTGGAQQIQLETPETNAAKMSGDTVAVTPGKTIAGAPVTPGSTTTEAPKASGAPQTQYDVAGLANWMKQNRESDMNEGMAKGSQYFGAGNPQMAEILDTKRTRALGLNGAEIQALRERANSGINSTMAAGLRANASTMARNGVHGGAAVGANTAVLARANQSRGDAERDIAIEDMRRRGQALDDYEKSVTGERAGILGMGASYADLGAGERSSALQYGLGNDFLNYYKGAAEANPNFDDGSWNAKAALDKWKGSGYDPNETPWSQWMHQNVFDKRDVGIDPEKWLDSSGLNVNRILKAK
jgi:hypothetical protein